MELGRSGDGEDAPLVGLGQTPNTTKNYARDIHILSASFLLVFLAYGAVQNLESTINTDGDLGTTSLGILYVSFTVFSLVSSLVVRKMGPKNALLLGSTGYWLFTAANLIPNWYTMVPASVYLGFTASIIWVGQGTYLTSTARAHARDNNLHEGSVIGNYNGEFGCVFASHQVVGNLLTLILLSDESAGGTTGTTLLFVVFLCTLSIGTILMCFLSKSNGKEEEIVKNSSVTLTSSLTSATKSVIMPLSDKRMLLIIPLFLYSGLQQAFVWAEFTKDIVKPALGESGVGLSMAVYGSFDAICALAGGRLTSSLKSVYLILAGGIFAQAVALIWILQKGSDTTGGVMGTVYPLTTAAALGIGDGVITTQLNSLLGMLFKHDTEGAFAQLKVWQCAAIAAIFFLMPYISLQAILIIMLIALSICVIAFSFLVLWVERAFSLSGSTS